MTVLTDAPVLVRPQRSAFDELRSGLDELVVAVRGDLDLATAPRVRAQLEDALAARPHRLVVDLADCSFVDASSLTMLLEAHRRTARAGRELVLRGCSPRVLRLLSITGLGRVFTCA